MNILLLTHRVPFPPNRGDRIRAFHLLRFLADHHRVSLACLDDEGVSAQTKATLSESCDRLAIVPQHRYVRWLAASASFARGRSATEGLFASRNLSVTIQRWAAERRPDCVVAFCSSMAPYAWLPALSGVPTIVDLVDVDSQKWFDYAQKSRGPKRSLYHREGFRLRRLEGELCRMATAVTLVSEAEAELFRHVCPNDRTHVVCNGVDLTYFQPAKNCGATASSCVFVGALDYGANIDGVQWFCQHVWPLVRATVPSAKFVLVGRQPTNAVQRLAKLPGVLLHANVADVRPLVEAAEVVIAPLRIARGVQNKVLEGMALGKPILASPEAIAGLHVSAGADCLVARSPAEWAAGLERLWNDPQERARLGTRGRHYVETHHLWDVTLRPLAKLIENAVTTLRGASEIESPPGTVSVG